MTISAVISPVIKRSLLNSVIGGWNGFISDVLGAMFSFTNNEYSTTVPGGQSRTFLETHVYTGAPKLTLKSNGLLKWNRHNLLNYAAYNSANWTTAGATVAVTSAVTGPDSGNGMLLFTASAGSSRHYAHTPVVTVPIGRSYTQTIYVRKANSQYVIFGGADHAGTFYCASFDLDAVTVRATNTGVTASIVDTGGGLFRLTVKNTQPANTGTSPLFGIDSASTSLSGSSWNNWTAIGTETAYCGYVMSSYGDEAFEFLGNSSATQPVLDEPTIYNTSGTRLGILLEPAATNGALQSNDLAASAYTVNRSVRSTSPQNGPLASTPLTRYTETATTGAHGVYSTAGITTTAAPWTLSVFARKGTRRYVLPLITQGANSAWAVFDLDTGTITGAAAVEGGVWSAPSAKIEDWGGGLYRLSITATLSAVAPLIAFYGSDTATIATLSTWPGYLGTVNDYADFGCVQFEAGSVATSYIPTTTAAVTRAADTCYRVLGPERLSGSGTAGTLVVKAIPYRITGTAQVADLDIGNSAGRVEVSINASTLRAGISGQTANPSLGTPVVGSSASWGIAYATNDAVACANGGTVQTDASVTLAQSYLFLRLGTATYGGEEFLGVVSRVRFWPSRITNAELQSATTDAAVGGVTLDFDYSTGIYQYTPVNAGQVTTYDLSTLISSGLMTLTGTPSAKWVRGSNGLLQQVAAGSLALEYDSTGALLGCINTEPARENLFTYSNDFSNAAWTKSALSNSSSGTLSPDGTANATKLTPTGASVTHFVSFANMASTSLSAQSIWAKADGYSRILIREQGVAGNSVCFDLSNGTIFVTNGANITGTIESWGNGWYRCSAVMTVTGTQGFAVYVVDNSYVSGDPSGYSWAGNTTDGVLVYGAQRERGVGYVSSYIPTTSASVTRNADVWTLNLGSWFDNSRWIVASKVYAPRANMTAGSVTPALWSLNLATPATTDYAVEWLSSTNRIDFHERTSSTDRAVGNATTLSFPATVRSGFGWSPDNTKASLNGASQTLTGTPGSIAAAYTLMRLGDSERSNVDQGSVYIQNIQIVPIIPTQANVNQYAGAA